MALYQSTHTGLEIDEAIDKVSTIEQAVITNTEDITTIEETLGTLEGSIGDVASDLGTHTSDETIHHTIDELDVLYEPKNSNIQEHIADATKHIDTTTAEFSGNIDETNDKLTIWDNSLLKWIRFSFTNLKTFIGTYFLKLDQTTPQTIQGLLQNKSTAALESAPLGAELLTSSNWTTTDWTGDFATGFTHTTGNVTPLTNTLAALNATLYQITYTITNITAGSINITFGGVETGAVSSSGAIGIKTASTGTLSITPTTDFNGTIVISIKSITGVYNPTYQILDSTGISTLEIRSSLNTLNNTFIGKGAGSYNTTGFQNSAQGVSALRNNTTGSYNSAQGVSALYNNTTGYNNSAQGVSALDSNTTGYNNSAQGVFALVNNTTGSNNSAQGVYAGRYLADGVTANQTSNNSVFLGYNTKSKQAGQTNEIVIGANAIGNGSNTATIGHTDVTDVYLRGKGHFTGSVQIGDDTAVASVANEFAIRGRKGINGNIGFSVTEMCMPTDVGTWNWVEIVRNEWIIP